MASENLNRWVSTYDLNKTSVHPLEKCSVYLFQTKNQIHSGPGGNEDPHGRLPMYHVWENDREIYCGSNLQHAYSVYRKALRDGLNRALG